MNEDFGGNLTDLPNDKYKKFFDKFKEIDTLNTKDWKTAHLLAYFCKKYKEQYQTDYKFKFNSPSPSKSFEVFQIKKLASMLTANPVLLKEYIDWIYKNKVVKAKRKLTSISFMTNEDVVNEYKFNVLLVEQTTANIERSTLLPEKYQTIFQTAGVTIKTYGELAFISQMSDMTPSLLSAFQEMQNIGFDKTILSRVV